MRRIFVFVMMFVLVAVSAFAQQSNLSQQTEPDLKGSITYKLDYVNPTDATDCTEHRVEAYARYKEWLGTGVETLIAPKSSYSFFRPYATITNGQLSGIAGYSTDSKNADYAFGGLWLTPKIGKLNVFIDVRNYFAISEKASSYQDNFIEVSYPATDKITIGIDGIYDHWWNNHLDFFLVGPVAYYAITDQVKIFARYSHEWGVAPQPADPADRFRIGLKFYF